MNQPGKDFERASERGSNARLITREKSAKSELFSTKSGSSLFLSAFCWSLLRSDSTAASSVWRFSSATDVSASVGANQESPENVDWSGPIFRELRRPSFS